MDAPFLVCVILALVGMAIMGAALARSPRDAPDIGEFLEGFDRDASDNELSAPFVTRLLGGVRGAASARLERMLPANYIEKLDRQLIQAGMRGKRRPSQQLALQLALGGLGLALVPLLPDKSSLMGLVSLVLLPLLGFMLPAVRLKRAIRSRSDAIFNDLPDIVDMLAIAVEAGCGFEAALSLICKNFTSPFTDELSVALHEMELGLPRREALQRLREHVDLDVVRVFVLSLLQADALGIPIGRVLKTQATEVRARRRAWARERAAKLPVKILFPLMAFIFPPIMALVLGPAAGSLAKF